MPTPPNIGQITLKPLDLKGRKEVSVNANASDGVVWTDLLDEDGFRVPGFDRANCLPRMKDALRHRITWKDKKVTELPPGHYHLRLHLQKAEVFALTLR